MVAGSTVVWHVGETPVNSITPVKYVNRYFLIGSGEVEWCWCVSVLHGGDAEGDNDTKQMKMKNTRRHAIISQVCSSHYNPNNLALKLDIEHHQLGPDPPVVQRRLNLRRLVASYFDGAE